MPGYGHLPQPRREATPLALRANVEHNHVRHEHVVIVSIEVEPVPRVPDERTGSRSIRSDTFGDGITHVTVRFGYTENTDVPAALASLTPAADRGTDRSRWRDLLPVQDRDSARALYLSMAQWRKRLFIATSHITADAAEHFGLPRDRVVLIGSHVEVCTGPRMPRPAIGHS